MIDKKKLANAEMSDDELDNIAGGYANEVEKDSKFLKDVGIMNETVSIGLFGYGWSAGSSTINDGWVKARVTCCTNC